MRSRIFIFLLIIAVRATAQSGYKVIYKRNDQYFPVTLNGEKRRIPSMINKIVFADSLCFSYYIIDSDPLKKAKVFGNKLIHHALLYNKNNDIVYSEINWPSKKDKYLVMDSSKKYKWTFWDDTKLVLGYKCKPALTVNEKNDSILVWFTPEIPEPYGPDGFYGLPGLILEVYDQRWGIHTYADRLEKGSFSVVFPTEGEMISSKEYFEIRKRQTH
jgi:GLPGLI family protein